MTKVPLPGFTPPPPPLESFEGRMRKLWVELLREPKHESLIEKGIRKILINTFKNVELTFKSNATLAIMLDAN